jgi:hypothetical protein
MRTNAAKLRELIHRVAEQDDVNLGVAKARFAGEANYSVPSLERLMRGEIASPDHVESTVRAVKARKLKFTKAELFLPEKQEESA